jgi:hypothetical protein
MKTIACVGDVRVHQIQSPLEPAIFIPSEGAASPNLYCWFPGGAAIAGRAIEDAVAYASPSPTVMRIETSDLASALVPSSTLWTVAKHAWPGESKPRLRLADPKSITNPRLPSVFRTITAPLPSALVDLMRAGQAPEILVIKDLGLFVREVPLFDLDQFLTFVRTWKKALPRRTRALPEITLLKDKLDDVQPDSTKPLRTAADYYRAAWSPEYYSHGDSPLAIAANAMILRMRRATYGLALRNLLSHMTTARQPSVAAQVRFRLSPLVILSVNAMLPQLKALRTSTDHHAHNDFARLDDDFDELPLEPRAAIEHQLKLLGPLSTADVKAMRDQWAEPHGLLQFICQDDLLAQHSVVVLNGSELRSQGITISEALSWERTAQDLQKAFREHPLLRKFSRVLHVIVRFGATGLFHADNSTHLSRPSHLHFDPLRDDSSYKAFLDGRVIGQQSVVIASLVQGMTLACHRGDGGVLPVDLGPAIADALPQAIRRCQVLCNFGYEALLKAAGASATSTHDPPKHLLLPDDLFAHPIAVQYDNATYSNKDIQLPLQAAIGHTPVATEFFDDWSIAVHSLNPDMLNLCQDVVRYGVPRSLNLPTWTLSSFLSAFRTALTRELRSKTITCTEAALRMLAPDPDPRNRILPGAAGSRLSRSRKRVTRDLCRQMQIVAWALRDVYSTGRHRFDNLFGAFANRLVSDKHFERRLATAIDKVVSNSDRALLVVANGSQYISLDGFLWSFFDALRLPRLFEETNPDRPAPLAYFGAAPNAPADRLIILDRREIEGARFIRNLIDGQFKGALGQKPLPIAVFGPPGSGKSFAIKQIINSISAGDSRLSIEWIEDNLAQKTDFRQLDETFEKITEAIAKKRFPVVFFDEFDASLRGALSWLKLFLAPMEDGTYNRRSVGGSILVFAGGTSETFRAFSREETPRESQEWLDFSAAKGPDFVSRLRGHLDIIGINHSGAIDRLYPLRRAIVLRSSLEKIQQLGVDDTARIESEVLHALMNVPRYRHGARSLRNLLGLFHNAHETISRSTLPPRAQAEMHVDAEAFWDLLFAPRPSRLSAMRDPAIGVIEGSASS